MEGGSQRSGKKLDARGLLISVLFSRNFVKSKLTLRPAVFIILNNY